jgi:hypothetical protein
MMDAIGRTEYAVCEEYGVAVDEQVAVGRERAGDD